MHGVAVSEQQLSNIQDIVGHENFLNVSRGFESMAITPHLIFLTGISTGGPGCTDSCRQAVLLEGQQCGQPQRLGSLGACE